MNSARRNTTYNAANKFEIHIMYVQKTKNPLRERVSIVVVGPGFEPRQTESETVVLPLHNPTKLCSF